MNSVSSSTPSGGCRAHGRNEGQRSRNPTAANRQSPPEGRSTHRAGSTWFSRTGSAKAGDLATTFTFEEIGADNRPLDRPRTFTVRGDVVYVDAWVVKYEDRFVESGDPLRSMSVCLFRRIFGESQQPRDGFVLNAVGSTPAAYRTGGTTTDLEGKIWSKFWDYANNPTLAGQVGVGSCPRRSPLDQAHAGEALQNFAAGIRRAGEGIVTERRRDA